jgi:GTPase KRas protein
MDESSRITITVCGDGGCGMRATYIMKFADLEADDMRRRQKLNHTAPRAKSMDVRIRPNNRCASLSLHAQAYLTYLPPEDSYSVTRTVDGVPYYLMLTDTAGQEEYRGLWASSNLKSDAFLLVYDITSPSSLESLEYFMEMIDMEEESRIDNGKTPPVKIVAGNKCDLQGQRQITAKDGLEWARRRKCGFMETSAREMVNIEETFARKCLKNFEQWGRRLY